ncbi:MAG: hypothetical protein NTV49_09300 [Kiritimatiellaeota bacterium]|nr:hypothetical protein [Kiritimatiellota bacterium]
MNMETLADISAADNRFRREVGLSKLGLDIAPAGGYFFNRYG